MSTELTLNQTSSTCALPDIVEAFTSRTMIACHAFILTVILCSFYLSYFATLRLLRQNVFPSCTKTLLLSSIINGVVHQGTTAYIRIRVLLHVIWYRHDPCSILFKSSDCLIEGLLYYHTNLFSSIVCVSLFLDRLFSFWTLYNSHQKKTAVIFILLQILIPTTILIWVFYDANYTVYVPMCNYPPPGSSEKFFIVNASRLYFFYALAAASLALFIVNRRREKKIVHKNYTVDARFKSYESYLGTKAVFYVIIVQVVCLAGTSYIPKTFNENRGSIPASWYHITLAFATGLTYANFFVPIIVCYQIMKIIATRHAKIQKLKIQPGQKLYFNKLQNEWDAKFEEFAAKNN